MRDEGFSPRLDTRVTILRTGTTALLLSSTRRDALLPPPPLRSPIDVRFPTAFPKHVNNKGRIVVSRTASDRLIFRVRFVAEIRSQSR